MRETLAVALFGMIGSVLRYWVGLWLAPKTPADIPWGTLVVNCVGCLLAGLLYQACQRYQWLDTPQLVAARVGFLGGLTTFSAFGTEIYRFLDHQQWSAALAVLLLHLLGGLACLYLGTRLLA